APQRFDNGIVLGLLAVVEGEIHARLGGNVAVDVGERLAFAIAHQILLGLVRKSVELFLEGELSGSLALAVAIVVAPAEGDESAKRARKQEYYKKVYEKPKSGPVARGTHGDALHFSSPPAGQARRKRMLTLKHL